MRIIGFGGCRINGPLSLAEATDPRVQRNIGSWIPATFALNEVVQALDVWSGDIVIPSELKSVISLWERRLVPQPKMLPSADCIVLETSAQVQFVVDNFAVNRSAISERLVKPFSALNKDAHRAVFQWFSRGLCAFDEEMRKRMASQLLAHISDDIPNADILKYLVGNLRSTRANPAVAFREIADRVNIPIGYVTHTFQFMADGRMIHVPEGFFDEVYNAVEYLGWPILNAENIIMAYGIQKAMRPDYRHYSDNFVPFFSERLVAFAAETIEHTKGNSVRDVHTA